ncbi:MAG: shikimate kinase [Acidimicrobiales bacterium]|nr:shikimate kinase [Acidimicrobiales bacterium]
MAPNSPPVVPTRHLALVGSMGAGKTAVGQVLAMRIRRRHVDLDRAVTQLAGRSIGVIFHEGGEMAFRDLESQCLTLQLAVEDPIVISTGGGVLGRDENRVTLAQEATLVWLRARPETLAHRVGEGVGRPLLEGQNCLKVLQSMAEKRDPVYELAADLVVDTDCQSIDEVVDELLRELAVMKSLGRSSQMDSRP